MTVTVSKDAGKIDIPSPGPAAEQDFAEPAGPTCTGARARALPYPARWGRGALHHLMVTVGDYRQVWEATPTPLGEVWNWARAGNWPGQKWAFPRGVYAVYGAVVAIPATAVAYWTAGALMQVSGLDDPSDPQTTGWTPSTPPSVGELWLRRQADVEAAEDRRRLVAFVEGAAIVGLAVALAVAWITQRLGRIAAVVAVAGACRVGAAT